MHHCVCVSRGLTFVALLLLVACATPQVEKKRYFWPPNGQGAKLEYIDFLQADTDVRKRFVSRLESSIFGEERPVPLFVSPYDVYSGGSGKLYVTEPSRGFVHVLDLENGRVGKLGPAPGSMSLEMVRPTGVAGGADGTVYVVDSVAGAILLFGPDDRQIAKWELEGVERPLNLAIDEDRGRIFVVAPDQHRVYVLSQQDGSVLSSYGGRGVAPGEFNFPLDLDVDRQGNLYVLDAMNARVQVFSPDGKFLRMFGERGTALGSFQVPKGIAVSASGHVYVTDSMSHRFVVFDRDGNYLMTVGGKFVVSSGEVAPGGFYLPGGIDIDDDESVWIIDAMNRLVHHFQYLNQDYLEKNPIQGGQAVVPVLSQ